MSIAINLADAADIETYDGLLDWIAQTLDRDDLQNQIPVFVRLAEYRIRRLIRSVERETTTDLTCTIGSDYVALPENFIMMRNAYLIAQGERVQMEQVNPSDIQFYVSQGNGVPTVYALSNGQMLLGRTPDDTYSINIRYIEDMDLLGPENQTNWLLTDHADVYIYGSLVQAEAFINDDPRVALWKAAFDESLAEVNKQGVQKRHGGLNMRLRSPVVV